MTEISTGTALKPTVREKPIPMISGVQPLKVVGGGQTPPGGAEMISDPVRVATSMPTSTETAMLSPANRGAGPNM